jgi:hypothetical protein
MDSRQDDPQPTGEPDPPHMRTREAGDWEGPPPDADDEADQTLEEPGYGHGV